MMRRKMASRLQAAQRGLTQRRRYATQRHAINAIQRLMRSYCVRFLHNPQRTKTSLQRELQRHQAEAARLAEEQVRLTAEKAQEVKAHSHAKAMLARTQKELADAQERANTERAKSAELMKAAELAKKELTKASQELAESRSARTHFLSTYRSMDGVFPPILKLTGGYLPQAASVRDDSTCFLVSIRDWAQCKELGVGFNSGVCTHLGVDWFLQVHPQGHGAGKGTHVSVFLAEVVKGAANTFPPGKQVSIGVLNMQSGDKASSQGKRKIEKSGMRLYNPLGNGSYVSRVSKLLELRHVDEFISNTGVLVAPHFVTIYASLSSHASTPHRPCLFT